MVYMTKSPSVWFWLFCIFTIFSAIAIDYYSSTTTSVVIFFMATVFTPILMASYATGLEPRDFKELLGLSGTLLVNVSMFLVGAGTITLYFFLVMKPMAASFIGTSLYSAWYVLYLPLVKSLPLAVLEPWVIMLFYIWISIGEEVLKLFGIKAISGALNKRGVPPTPSIIIAMVASLFGWLILHVFAWGPGFLLGLPIGYVLSFVFYLPYWTIGDGLLSPETGIQWERMCIFCPVAGHWLYDVYIEFYNSGIALNPALMILSGIMVLVFGIGIAIYGYYRKGLPLFGYLPIGD